ncbi:catechol 1,2-dioxygenase [Aquirufa ecclesiirivi]|uniref:dioxygenase family protein n=1 Tax=Aquirufa ecclesiirivi TaxID=2715124 RepID=UPI0022A8AACA|nr:catechol 1,2-dioxygenase [Aquirufa ecclesiirivi]MCZ2471379.1 catechol 1,2-dioxygenase [Aquirufa ecclesiirivi]
MQRRTFIKNSTLFAAVVSTNGFIHFDGHHFVGDCETTSDILGPYYRPNSPLRNNLIIKGQVGNPIELSGIIKHKDCITPYKNAKIELWHCDSKGVYDNTSSEYRYRGTSYSDENGQYSFKTILPVPYDAGGGHIRPAHFHLMITAEGYQPLVTQLYFSGDAHIPKDMYASSKDAKNRILDTETLKDGSKKVLYHVSMSKTLNAEAAAIDKLTGLYTDLKDKSKKIELFTKNKCLWMKNEVFGENFEYVGNNTFEYPAMPKGMYATLIFEIMPNEAIKLTYNYVDDDLVKHSSVSIKEF